VPIRKVFLTIKLRRFKFSSVMRKDIIHNRPTCIFHSLDTSLHENEFTNLLNNKIKQYLVFLSF
jgi:hypothetical protein